jgi:hypothetical protein
MFFFEKGVSLCHPGWIQTSGLKKCSSISLLRSWGYSDTLPHPDGWILSVLVRAAMLDRKLPGLNITDLTSVTKQINVIGK